MLVACQSNELSKPPIHKAPSLAPSLNLLEIDPIEPSSEDGLHQQTHRQVVVKPSQFLTDVPLLSEAHLSKDFWLKQTIDLDTVLLNFSDILEFNQNIIRHLPEVVDVLAEAESYSDTDVRSMIRSLSKPTSSPRFYGSGKELIAADWLEFNDRLGLSKLPKFTQVQFALVTRRGSLRTFPTTEAVFSSPTDRQIDRFQETAVFPGEALQVLHYSDDFAWAFVRHYHYNGWLAVEHFALTDKKTVEQFVKAESYIVVTGDKVQTNANPTIPDISNVQLEMGVKLPRLVQHDRVIHGQNSSYSFVVQLPVRQGNGQLRLQQALISRNQDVATEYLPFTKRHIIQQAFKFLGERYGWGHALHARDCSGFIGEVFRSFGLILPRNTSVLGQEGFGSVLRLKNASAKQKHQAVKATSIGDLIFIPGHVMLVIGQDKGEPFVIHDVVGLNYRLPHGRLYHSALNGVSITPISPLLRNNRQTYIDAVYLIKNLSQKTTSH